VHFQNEEAARFIGIVKKICFNTRHADVNEIKIYIMLKVDQRDGQIRYLTKKSITYKKKNEKMPYI
jgi:hypothetical protein